MIEVAKRIGVGALLLMILPSILWIGDWQWKPENNFFYLKGWYWITQTVSPFYGIFNSILMMIYFISLLRYRFKPALSFIIIFSFTMFFSQWIKSLIKEQVKEPRPYLIWINNYIIVNEKIFRDTSYKECTTTLLKKIQQTQQQKLIPVWLQGYWCEITDSSFPSGHTIFAVNWALLAIGLVWPRRKIITVMIMLWASAVMISRMFLGMHWPHDIIVSITISWFIITITCCLLQYAIDSM